MVFDGQRARFVLSVVLVSVVAACGGERPYRTGYEHRTVSDTEFEYKRIAAKVEPQIAVETVELQAIRIHREQRRSYRKYRKRRDSYGSWSTRKTRKGASSPASGIRVALSSASKGLSAEFVDNGNDKVATTNADGLVSVRSKLNGTFKVFTDAPIQSVVSHPEIVRSSPPKSSREREWFQLTTEQRSSGSRKKSKSTYRSRQGTYDIRPILKKVARLVHAEKTVTIRIIPANIDSRSPFRNASITLTPLRSVEVEPRQWLRKHLKLGEHLTYAAHHFPAFVRKEAARTSGRNGAVFRVVPGPYTVTVTHPKYYYLEKVVGLGRGQPEVTVLMSELGTKHRVEIVQ